MDDKRISIYKERASIYKCDDSLFGKNGVTVVPIETMRGKNYITLACYENHSLIRIDPEMDNPVADLSGSEQMTPDEIFSSVKSYYENKGRVLEKLYCYFYYLKDEPYSYDTDLPIDRIDETNQRQLDDFLGTLSEEEIDLADIELDNLDPVIFGGFDRDKMIAYVSHRYPDGHEGIGDIGIVIDSEYRGKGYGKAMLSKEIGWCLDNNIIPMYVVMDKNIKSKSLVESMGFTKLGDIYILK